MKTPKSLKQENSTRITWTVTDEDLNKSETLTFIHSQHSIERAKQRNIDQNNIAFAIEYGTAFFKQGLVFYVLGENNIPDSMHKRNRNITTNLVVVVAGDSNTILTCYRSSNPFKHIKKKQKNLAKPYQFAA